MKYDKVRKNPNQLLSLTGFTPNSSILMNVIIMPITDHFQKNFPHSENRENNLAY